MKRPMMLSRPTIILHWLVALFIVFGLTSGLIMIDRYHSFYETHKSFGVLAVLVVIPRVVWRVIKGWPKPENVTQTIETKLSKIVHWVLILGSVMMPLSGMLASGASGYGFGIFEFVRFVPPNVSEIDPSKIIPYSGFFAGIGYTLHTYVGYSMVVALGLHIAGAIKHHCIYKDATLRRMLGRA